MSRILAAAFAACLVVCCACPVQAAPILINYDLRGSGPGAPTTFNPTPPLGLGGDPTLSISAASPGSASQSGVGLGVNKNAGGILDFRIDNVGGAEVLELTLNNPNPFVQNVELIGITFEGFPQDGDTDDEAQIVINGNIFPFSFHNGGLFDNNGSPIPFPGGSTVRFSLIGPVSDAFAVAAIQLQADGPDDPEVPEPAAVFIWLGLLAVVFAGMFLRKRLSAPASF